MAGISTSIQLNDRMTPVLQSITNSMNLMISSFYVAQSAAGTAFDTASMVAARQEIASASAELAQYQDELERVQSMPVKAPEPPNWTSVPSQPVFMSSGADRFAAEYQAANQAAQRMYKTQQQISAQARGMRVTPPGMLNDVEVVGNRVQALADRIQELNSIPINLRTDRVNNELEQMRGNLAQITSVQDDLNGAVARMDIRAANTAYQQLDAIVGITERDIRDNISAQNQFNQSLGQGHVGASGLEGTIKRYAAAILSVATVGKVISIADEMTQTAARLNLVNDGMQTTYEFQQMIYQSAQRSRASYATTADIVAKLGQRARGAFASNAETVQFAENLNKQFAIAGASQQEMTSASLQLTQALGSGVLRGEELNAVFEAAPNVIQTIADYMGVPIGEVRNLASEGAVSAEVVKNAMLAATNQINDQFNSMPMTFGQVATAIQNQALMAFQPALQQLSALAQTPEFQSMASNVTSGIQMMAQMAVSGLDMMAQAAVWAQDNWWWLVPVVAGVTAAMVAYKGAIIACNIVQGISNGLQAISIANTALKTGVTFMEAAATTTATGAQVGFNAALLACPLTWIVLAVMAVVIAIAIWVNHIGGLKAAWLTCVNAVKTAGDSLQLAFSFMSMHVQNALDNMQYAFAAVKVGILNALSLMKVGGLQIIQSFLNGAIDRINRLLAFVNQIPGVSIKALEHVELVAGAVVEEQSRMQQRASDLAAMREGNSADAKARRQSYMWDKMQADAARDQREWEIRQAGKESKNSANDQTAKYHLPAFPTFDSLAGGAGGSGGVGDIAGNTGDTAGNTARMADSMDMAEEDLKYLRDAAEQEVINRFTTAELTVNMGGITNQVNGQMDLDGINSYLEASIYEVLETAAEGVY